MRVTIKQRSRSTIRLKAISYSAAMAASQGQAEGGTDNQRYMTSLGTKQQITARLADQPTAEAGNDDFDLMTSLGTKRAIWARKATVSSTEFGVSEGASDNKAALEYAFAQALADGKALKVKKGLYQFSTLVTPDDLILEADGVTWRHDGSATGSDIAFTLGDNVRFDQLSISTPGTETAIDFISLGDGVSGGALYAIADAQRAGGGITTRGQDVRIDSVVARKIDRPLHLYNESTTPVTGVNIGFLDCEDYIRAFRADNVYGRLGGLRAVGRSPNAVVMTAGQNGILLVGDTGLDIGDCWIEDAAEHAIRVGGSAAGTASKTLRLGNVVVKKSAGCAIKLNPTLLASPSVTETVNDVQIGNVLAIDVGEGDFAGNKEILRFSHVRNVQMGAVLAVADAYSASGQYLLQINDARNVQIESLGGPANSGAISFDGTSDITPGEQFGGDVIGLRIGRLHGTVPGVNAIAVNTTFNVADVHIGCDGLSGYTTNLCRWIAGTLTGVFRLSGWVGGSVAPAYQGAPVSDNFQVDVTWNNQRAIGRASGIRGTAALELAPPAFSSASQAPSGLMLNSVKATAGSGSYGAMVEFTRLGSSRRAAAIAARQGSADDKEVGLDFLTGDSNTTANESLVLAMRLTHLQRVELPSTLTKYADNAAAVTAGLAAGTLYWTTTGEARVVV